MSDERLASGAAPMWIGRYRILSNIAAGGMGTVYLASVGAKGGSRRVALKVLHPHHAQDEEIARRFVVEGQLGARIAHPNVVEALDAGQADGFTYLALEYIDGLTLSTLLRSAGNRTQPVPLGIVASILLDVLAGLHAAHEVADEEGRALGIVHRDVSPQNILVDREGRAYLSDFGIAKIQDSLRATSAGLMVGKVGYMAPEQLTGGEVSSRTDLYATGIVLWESLVGLRLFSGVEAQIQAIVNRTEPARLRTLRPDVPEALERLVAQLLETRHEARPHNAFEVSTQLRAAVPRASRSEVASWMRELAGELPRPSIPAVSFAGDDELTITRTAPHTAPPPASDPEMDDEDAVTQAGLRRRVQRSFGDEITKTMPHDARLSESAPAREAEPTSPRSNELAAAAEPSEPSGATAERRAMPTVMVTRAAAPSRWPWWALLVFSSLLLFAVLSALFETRLYRAVMVQLAP